MSEKIIRNSAHCRACGDDIESKYCHDFVACRCGKIFVDGGKDYLRRGGDFECIEDTSLIEAEKESKTRFPEGSEL